ncbi:hypothetical protein [uncultured Desulfuromonas sp.]|uniref:hypothetical protein n=1 Tax=uncultured Desulfuromonas sp. TaxID=181013 RepID=UPI002AAABE23|nr:hypothetical protein [uncultured Desulfuromonas sp.]
MKRTCTLLPLSTAPIFCTACSDTCGNGLSRRQGAVDAMVGEMDNRYCQGRLTDRLDRAGVRH